MQKCAFFCDQADSSDITQPTESGPPNQKNSAGVNIWEVLHITVVIDVQPMPDFAQQIPTVDDPAAGVAQAGILGSGAPPSVDLLRLQ